MAELCTIVVLVLGIWLMVEMVKNRMPQSSKAGAEVRTHVNYKGRNVLIVRDRHPSLREALVVEAGRDVLANYTPDRYVYQSVSSGGVTTGGVTKLQGGYSMRTGDKTGDYFLTYKYAKYNEFGSLRWSAEYIGQISLSEKDYALARKDRVLKRFLVSPEHQKDLVEGYGARMTATEAKTGLRLGQMSKEEAEHVRSWLAGEC